MTESEISDAAAARAFRRSVAGSVAVVTTRGESGYRGTTVTAFIVASIEPFEMLISIDSDSQMVGWLQSSAAFALSVLPWHEQFRADQFSGFAPAASGSFERIPHFIASTGSPILGASTAWVDCRIENFFATGDHTAFVGRVVTSGLGSKAVDQPLLYFASQYRQLG